MGFLDSVTKFTTGVAEKTKGNVDVFSLNQQISNTEKEIGEIYKQLGNKYYELHKDAPEEALAGFITSITENYAKIDQLRADVEKKKAEIAAIELTDKSDNQAPTKIVGSGKVCPKCGSPVGDDELFCGNCGAPQPKNEPVAEEKPAEPEQKEEAAAPVEDTRVFCKNCGTELTDGARFCPTCGKEA